MKKLLALFFVLFILFFQNASAQKDAITATFNDYIKASKSDNVEAEIAFFHEDLFNFFSKDDFKKALEMIKNNPMVTLGNEKIISISDVYSENNMDYALLSYKQMMMLDLNSFKNEQGTNEEITQMMIELKKQYGEDDVNFNQELFQLEINLTLTYYTILDPKIGSWKLLPKEDKTANITEQIIPEAIRKKI